jgi:uncharacterized iron-regulated membrane protein
MKASTIKKWFEIHKWTSLICTIFLLMLCLTGLPLIFSEEIDHFLESGPKLPEVTVATPVISKDSVLQNALASKPGKVIKYVYWDDEEPRKMGFTMGDSPAAPDEANVFVTMDDRTGKVLESETGEMTFMLVMYYLHVNMFAGLPGELFLGLMGILFIVAIISGVVLYGPIMKRFDFGIIRTEKSSRLRYLDLHNVLGIITLAWATVVGLTGVINTLAEPALNVWKANELAQMVSAYKNKPAITGKLSSLSSAIEKAKQAAPDMDVSFIAYPGTPYSSKHHYAVFMQGVTPLTSRIIKPALIDAETGELTDIRDLPWYLKTIFISQPFHFGDYGGIPLKIIWTIFDIATIVVLITGLYLWFARRKAKAAQIARLTDNIESLTLNTVQENGN